MTRGCGLEFVLALALSGCSGPAFSTAPTRDAAGAAGSVSGAGNGGQAIEMGGAPSNPGVPDVVPGGGVGGSVDTGGSSSGGSSPGGAAAAGASLGGASAAGSSSVGGSTSVEEPRKPVFGYLPVESTAQRGNLDKQAFLDECPHGSVLVGVNAEVSQGIVSRLQGVCGVPTIEATDPTAVSIVMGETLEPRGCVDGDAVSRSCPAGSAVIGFEGRSGLLLDQLRLRCAPLQIVDGNLALGSPQELAPIGATGGSPFQRADCPSGALATGTNINVDVFVSGFGLPCASVALEWKVSAP